MATLEEFLRTGHLGPLNLGISATDVMSSLGEPDGISRKSNPLLLVYGRIQLTFWRNAKNPKPELREIALDYQRVSEPLSPTLEFTDWNSTEPPTERRFRDFMHQVGYLPVHQSEGATWCELVFPSGATARFRDEMLESIRLIGRENKSSPIAFVSDEREPTPEQISDMFSEATLAVQAGAKRAARSIAWAGLEATLRRAAFRAGRRGKVGTQPVVLLRELVAEGQVTAPEHRTLEHLRQLRMSAAHGLTPVAFPPDLISNIKAVSDRLLATTT